MKYCIYFWDIQFFSYQARGSKHLVTVTGCMRRRLGIAAIIYLQAMATRSIALADMPFRYSVVAEQNMIIFFFQPWQHIGGKCVDIIRLIVKRFDHC
jgi:hypothetical protein